ncbi:MAG: DUF512 domain-containing protein [Acidibacillus sp.]|uniref:Fe-S oxidoreductase n=1 Tax=Sulfoacidibacillus ferrooxidans TaxID=2005001 RepID=A0A9X2AEA4_9BACL|nr:DUF512 domain-containing protein [Sulfoacidibacillus ferrooxidans]MCI0184345.1 hypothetical protein [Sulfoacidibacillus ferrooxidans]MCY0894290.1 DUF512 domain-containing protein [Acidibacillus sp.]
MPKVLTVHPGSLAEELQIEPGDDIVAINGQPIRDVIDLQFALAGEDISLDIRKSNGDEWVVEVDKDYDESLGVDWEHPTVDKVRLCHNKCVFCFVDQVPKNMRKTLNMRDDDYRLSFLHGNFVTLTNLREGELERIAALRMSPLNISVHATNPVLREQMLGNKKSGEILEQIAYLSSHDIEMNTQVVLCPEWNDGAELDRTIEELSQFYPAVRTLSIVPVGLTKHRRGLAQLRNCSAEEARQIAQQVAKWQNILRPKLGVNFVHAADEFYCIGDSEIPTAMYYDEFAQIENGVGLLRTFLDEFTSLQKKLPRKLQKHRHVAIVTGTSAQKVITSTAEQLNRIDGLTVDVYPIVNEFYGDQVTVTGLITGQDIIAQLRDRLKADVLLIPDVMLKDDADIFLDDYRVEQVRDELNIEILVVPPSASGIVYGALGKTHALPVRQRYEATLTAAVGAAASN